MQKHVKQLITTTILLIATLAACGPAGEPTSTPVPTAGNGEPIIGMAQVDAIEIMILESFPVQIHVVARGNLPDGCTTIDQITEKREGDTFQVTVTTSRPAGKTCTQVVVPFEEVIALDVHGLPAGTYRVNVNGATGTFTLDMDNIVQEG